MGRGLNVSAAFFCIGFTTESSDACEHGCLGVYRNFSTRVLNCFISGLFWGGGSRGKHMIP